MIIYKISIVKKSIVIIYSNNYKYIEITQVLRCFQSSEDFKYVNKRN